MIHIAASLSFFKLTRFPTTILFDERFFAVPFLHRDAVGCVVPFFSGTAPRGRKGVTNMGTDDIKRKPLYQPWSEEAFRADIQVMAMAPRQRWMYRTLLQAAFFCSTRPYLPDDDAQLWMLAGCESLKQWERDKYVVRAMFTPVEMDGVRLLSQKRLLADWTRIAEKRQALAEAGRKGGQANGKQDRSKCLADAKPSQAGLKQEKLKRSEVKGSEERTTTAKPGTAGAALILIPTVPDWIPSDAWNAYLKLRKAKRAKVTPEAVELLIRDLAKWRAEGKDVRAILEQSVKNGWTGIFPVKEGHHNGDSRGKQPFDVAANHRAIFGPSVPN